MRKMCRYDLKMLKRRLKLLQMMMLEKEQEKSEEEMYKRLQRKR